MPDEAERGGGPGRVGFIGLGLMGQPMAHHLLRAAAKHGGELWVHSRRQSSAADLVDSGAHWADTPRELAGRCDVVISMLPDLPEVAELLDGDDGLLAGLAGPTVLVISSTSAPTGVRELADDLTRRTDGLLTVVDAPVSGGVEGAAAGTLSIMVGGGRADVDRVMPWLGAMGTAVHLGPVGAGEVAKACNQLIVAATTVALGEASVIAERAGLDLAKLLDLLGGGYAGSRILEVKKAKLIAHEYPPAGRARFLRKDLGFAAAEAERSGVAAQVLPVLHEVFDAMVEGGLGDHDSISVQKYILDRSL
ncbi:NAD(P)-dependent oxidoreductase [Georgenia sp. SYP-B2076]|uniref:NAD(P)-dependent oxidoreductase n=1 Tax=Georgenia sp. SYP-B2076 TaxID=2495881 RepID=UPI000F8D7F7C|nr:NAD(P)-dependent oxidoreductase [Georgenia sp. SYP-B2076]